MTCKTCQEWKMENSGRNLGFKKQRREISFTNLIFIHIIVIMHLIIFGEAHI